MTTQILPSLPQTSAEAAKVRAPAFPLAAGSALAPFAAKLLAALQRLTRERVQHPCGGFNIDDMRWQMGLVFEPDETMHEAMDELLNARLIRFAGYDENAAYESCYAPC